MASFNLFIVVFSIKNTEPFTGPLRENTEEDTEILQRLGRGFLARKQMKAMKAKEIDTYHTIGGIADYKKQKKEYQDNLLFEKRDTRDPEARKRPYTDLEK